MVVIQPKVAIALKVQAAAIALRAAKVPKVLAAVIAQTARKAVKAPKVPAAVIAQKAPRAAKVPKVLEAANQLKAQNQHLNSQLIQPNQRLNHHQNRRLNLSMFK